MRAQSRHLAVTFFLPLSLALSSGVRNQGNPRSGARARKRPSVRKRAKGGRSASCRARHALLKHMPIRRKGG